MTFSQLVQTILEREDFEKCPPTLLDIGASGEINQQWKSVAPYAICLAVDADSREMGYSEKLDTVFKKTFLIHSVLTVTEQREAPFYLTKSPFCSSSLEPDEKALASWQFYDLFTVEKQAMLPSKALPSALEELGIGSIDWFKTDSQGTDLRLFLSLPELCREKVLVAEFEPGILDAYHGEDKLWQVLRHMEKAGFWMSQIHVRGTKRISKQVLAQLRKMSPQNTAEMQRSSPGWGELTFFNTMQNPQSAWKKREYLLMWIFACIDKQFGFAAEIAAVGKERFPDPVFSRMEEFAYATLLQKRTVLQKVLVRTTRFLQRMSFGL